MGGPSQEVVQAQREKWGGRAGCRGALRPPGPGPAGACGGGWGIRCSESGVKSSSCAAGSLAPPVHGASPCAGRSRAVGGEGGRGERRRGERGLDRAWGTGRCAPASGCPAGRSPLWPHPVRQLPARREVPCPLMQAGGQEPGLEPRHPDSRLGSRGSERRGGGGWDAESEGRRRATGDCGEGEELRGDVRGTPSFSACASCGGWHQGVASLGGCSDQKMKSGRCGDGVLKPWHCPPMSPGTLLGSQSLPAPPCPPPPQQTLLPAEERLSWAVSFSSTIARRPTSKRGTKVGPRASPPNRKQPACPSVTGHRGPVGQGRPLLRALSRAVARTRSFG